MKKVSEQINQILSLRAPQKASLEILEQLVNILPLEKEQDLSDCLAAVRAQFSDFEDFEREFPSFCFSLATGVGKTRLMGAFIAYLHIVKGIRHFFVLAPNLTIYNKLIQDFTPNSDKYVLKGIPEFCAQPPEIITGDDFEKGHGVRNEYAQQLSLFDRGQVHINIFNIAKINAESRGDNEPRIKRLSEYIGTSYFEYLSELDDLVLLMDESHRYRASAGVRAINELKPILGLEFTATSFVERGTQKFDFKNRIYDYPLSQAINDGYVKVPAVGGRENFRSRDYGDSALERLKLEDGIRIHEKTKIELQNYALNERKEMVKPFVLVVAQDTSHADSLLSVIKSDQFFDGFYKDKVLVVHSKLRGDEEDLTINQLLSVESHDNPIEIVIHVNMLKEGWDVKNLYTIIPLRAANARGLLEQSIGRGLRLPYGKRVENHFVDTLTIVSHDRFNEIVDEANRPDSLIKKGMLIGEDVPLQGSRCLDVKPIIHDVIQGSAHESPNFGTPSKKAIASATLELLPKYESLPNFGAAISQQTVNEIAAQICDSESVQEPIEEVAKVVHDTLVIYREKSIDIPRIHLEPKGDQYCGYRDFDLQNLDSIHLQPVSEQILIQRLNENGEQERLFVEEQGATEPYLENYIVRGLIDHDDVCIELHGTLIYKLASQIVEHLRSYLNNDEDVVNVLRYHQKELVQFVRSQMQTHYVEPELTYETTARKGFVTLRSSHYSIPLGEEPIDFRPDVEEKRLIKGLLFNGFKKCLYPVQRFDSNSEKDFSKVLESDPSVVKWVKPGRGDFPIFYHKDHRYEPDFVVETANRKYLCEIKRECDMGDPVVLNKAKAASKWCGVASEHASTYQEKPWAYLLIPHNVIVGNATLEGLAAAYTFKEVK